MVYSSQYIAQQVYSSQQQHSGLQAIAMQRGYGLQRAMYPGQNIPPPPPPPPPPMMSTMYTTHGVGARMDQMGGGMASTMGRIASGAGTLGMLGASMAGFDPIMGGIRGLASRGLMGAVGGATAMGLPLMAMGAAGGAYLGAWNRGAQEQVMLNQTLRNNFGFAGGQGPMGYGFSGAQMNQIGSSMVGFAQRDPTLSTGLMTNLIGQGAQSGMFSAVRDVQEFTKKFTTMLNTLKGVQDQLGGTLEEAMTFVRQSKTNGIFSQADRIQYASDMRGAMATTGMSQDQLMSLSNQGAQISRMFGGFGRQGARGALRSASRLGAAVSAGIVNEEALSEATGGLTGTEALSSFVASTMQMAGRHSRRAAGRYSLFALSNEDGTGIDQEMLARFRMGDLTTSDVQRRAYSNVGAMGRGRALNREGILRGAVMEEGGLSAMIGMMRLRVGDRILDQGDDRTQLYMQRRLGMSRSQAQVMTSLMRNQGTIAAQESMERESSRRRLALETDHRENRSLGAVVSHLGRSVGEAMGLPEVNRAARSLVTTVSDFASRVVNRLMGIAEQEMTSGDRQMIRRMIMGQSTDGDLLRIQQAQRASSSTGNDFARSLDTNPLLSIGPNPADRFRARGINISGMSDVDARAAINRYQMAQSGNVIGADVGLLESMNADRAGTLATIQRARMGHGGVYDNLRRAGITANAADAFMHRHGYSRLSDEITEGSMMGRSLRSWGDTLFGSDSENRQESALSFLASGGTLGAQVRRASYTDQFASRRSLLKGYAGTVRGDALSVSEEAMASLLQSDEFSTGLNRVLNSEGDARANYMDALRTQAESLSGEAFDAANSLVTQIDQRIQEGRGVGDIKSAVDAASMTKERADQIMGEVSTIRGHYSSLSTAVGGELGDLLARAGEADGEEYNGARMDVVRHMASMDPNSEEYRNAMRAMGRQGQGGEGMGAALMAAAAQRRQLDRAMSRGGYRGRRQASETALGLLTGNTFSDMDITGGGDRRLTAHQTAAALAAGGERGDTVRNELIAQLEGRGVGNAEQLVTSYQEMLAQDSEGGRGLSAEERDRLITATQSDEQLRQVNREALQARQRQMNPLDSERNDLLRGIKAALESGEETEGGESPETP